MKRYSVCVKGSGNSRSRNAHRCVHSSKCIGGGTTTSSACSLSAINSLPWSPDEEKVIVRNASVTIRCISKRKNDTNERYTIIEDIENWGKHKILTVRACLTILLQLRCGIHGNFTFWLNCTLKLCCGPRRPKRPVSSRYQQFLLIDISCTHSKPVLS